MSLNHEATLNLQNYREYVNNISINDTINWQKQLFLSYSNTFRLYYTFYQKLWQTKFVDLIDVINFALLRFFLISHITVKNLNFRFSIVLQSSLVYFKYCLCQVSFISSRASRLFQVSRSPPRPTISLSRDALRSARKKWEEWGRGAFSWLATEAVVGTPRDLK